MAYNFQAIDYSKGFDNINNQWNTINNAFQGFANGMQGAGKSMVDFQEQREKWEEMRRKREEEDRKKNLFNKDMSNLKTSVDSDKAALDKIDVRSASKSVLENKKKELGEAQEAYDKKLLALNDKSNTTPMTNEQLQKEYQALGERPEDPELDAQIENLDWSVNDTAKSLSDYAAYIGDPAFDAALKQAELNEDFSPIINYIQNYTSNKRAADQFEYTKSRDLINDKFRDKELQTAADAKKQEAVDTKLGYELGNSLSFLDGLNFNRNGVVTYGPDRGKTMETLLAPVITKFLDKGMSEEAIYKTISDHQTMARYMKGFADKASTKPPKKPPKY